jgi:hypothetical protein
MLSTLNSNSVGPALSGIKQAVEYLKGALDERDSWEVLAAEHDSKSVGKLAQSSPSHPLATRRIKGKQSSRNPATRWKIPTPLSWKRINRQVVQDLVSYRSTITTGSGGITETNFNWNLNSNPLGSSWQVLFDSWMITKAKIQLTSTQGPGSTASIPIVHTAIDYDSINNIGTLQFIDEFENLVVKPIGPGRQFTRTITPATSPDIGGQSGGGTGASWVDTAFPSINFYGYRTMFETASSGSTISVEVTLWYAFRNGN